MRLAFYAPLKPPDHPNMSGDRRIARLLMRALRLAGHEVLLASRFRSREGDGDVARQRRLRRVGERLAARLVRRWLAAAPAARPAAWFTYHLYYKAPDWLGPPVAEALAIPYVAVEASYAPKRDWPPWQEVHRAVGQAIARASAIVTLNSDDVGCLLPLLDSPERIHRLAPFIDVAALVPAAGRESLRAQLAGSLSLDPAQPWLVCVAMMRAGDKLDSYRLLGQALARLRERPWQLVVVGEGRAEAEVKTQLRAIAGRVRYAGAAQGKALGAVLAACDLYVWPAVNEAFGMAFLEASACGLPIVAGRTRGVPDLITDGETGLLAPVADVGAFADAVGCALDAPGRTRAMGAAGAARIRAHHDLPAASRALDTLLAQLVAAP